MTSSIIEAEEPNIVPASSICKSIFDGTHESPKRQDCGYKLVTSRHIKANKVLTEDAYFISKDDYAKINERSGLQIGDVLFTMIGTVGEVCRITEEPNFAIKNIGVFRAANLSDSVWIYYYFLSPVGRKNIEAAKRGTTQQFMGLKELREFPINFPKNSNYRKRQVKILELLDAKIVTNNAISKTLENMAQTIFKSWFIDFDPVNAKMAGEKPAGMDDATAALFPHTIEESELGPIPKGWEVRKIGSLTETLLGGTPSRKREEFWGGEIPWINSGKVNDFRITTASEYITELGLEKSATKLLPKGTTVIAITGATLGQFSRLEIDACANQSVVGLVCSTEASNEFIFFNIKNGIQRLISAQTGGAQQHINKEDVNAFSIVYPGKRLMNAFTEFVEPLFAQIGVLLHNSITLATIRDSLLPRLISGDLQIPEEMLAS